jgi:hypothetical protein
MPIPVRNNVQYGGDSISQKYSPLEVNDTNITNNEKKESIQLFKGRISKMLHQNMFPSTLNFYTRNWEFLQRSLATDTAKPPIVVVSSNRAKWIKKISDLAESIQADNFDNVNDERAVKRGSTPWYDVKRVNDPDIRVVVLVHRTEYEEYQTALQRTGMTVVGWAFDYGKRDKACVGFGPTRYAAIEFCKYIFNTRINPLVDNPPVPLARQKAWIVDDNVVYIQSFPGFDTVVGQMDDSVLAFGFDGATRNTGEVRIKALKETAAASLDNLDPGLLQQCVLWNIGLLKENSWNFSPYFLSCNEDSSFSSFLQNRNVGTIGVCTGATIIKGEPESDAGQGSKRLTALRSMVASCYYTVEASTNVAPTDQQNTTTMRKYVADTILPNASETVRNENRKVTQSKAFEQIMAKVVRDWGSWVPGEIFQRDDQNAQVVTHFTV